MSRDKRYQRLLNDRRWWGPNGVKIQVWKRAGGLCEECYKDGIVRAGVDCHHIVPVETGRTEQEMERLAYDVNNCRLLCIEHHIEAHVALRSHSKENVMERKQKRRIDFMRRNDPNFMEESTPDTKKRNG